MGRMNLPDICSLIAIVDPGFSHDILFRVLSDVPIDKLVRCLSIYKNILRYWHCLVLQRMSVSRKATSSACGPSCPVWLDPDNVINKLKSLFHEDLMKIIWDCDSLRCFATACPSNQNGRHIDDEEPTLIQYSVTLAYDFLHLEQILFILNVFRIFRTSVVIGRRSKNEIDRFRGRFDQKVLAIAQSHRVSQMGELRHVFCLGGPSLSHGTPQQARFQHILVRGSLVIYKRRKCVNDNLSHFSPVVCCQWHAPYMVPIVNFRQSKPNSFVQFNCS